MTTDKPVAEKKPRPDIKSGAPIRGLIPSSRDECAALAMDIFKSGMTPDSYIKYYPKYRDDKGNLVEDHVDDVGTMARLMVGIWKGMEAGLPPIAAISTIYIVNNRPTIYGDGALALILNSGKCEFHKEWLEGKPKADDWIAVCQFKRTDNPEIIERRFSWAQARAAGLSGKSGPWSKYPERQMIMRARAWAERDGFADVLMGLGITEEVMDFDVPEVRKQEPSVQQDEFTMKALAHLPAATVDFSLLGAEKREPVPVQQEQTVVTTGASVEIIDKTLEEKPAPAEKQPCTACGGKGVVPWKETNPETGELSEGIEPCPECKEKQEGTEK